MTAFAHGSEFSGQPYADDVAKILGSAHHAIKMATIPFYPRPSRSVQNRIFHVLNAIQFFPMYLQGTSMSGVKEALDSASSAIEALHLAVDKQRRSVTGRIAQWFHFPLHPEEYVVVKGGPSGKGVGLLIPNLLAWKGPVEIHDPKASPDTLH